MADRNRNQEVELFRALDVEELEKFGLHYEESGIYWLFSQASNTPS